VLGALRLGSADASDLLPRVLDLLGRHRALVMRDFKSGAVRVPAWRFARWLTQMMSRLDKPEGDVVAVIVIAVARQLPHAAFYAFNVARHALGACAAVRRVERHVMLPHLQKFIAELRRLTHPELRLKAWRDQVRQRIDEPDSPARTEFLRERFAELRDIMRTDATAGTYNKHFAKARAAAVFAVTGANGEKLRTLRKKQLDAATNGWSYEVPNDQKGAYKSLADFSPWLAHYDDSDRTVGGGGGGGGGRRREHRGERRHRRRRALGGASGGATADRGQRRRRAADGIELPGQYDPLSHVPPPTSSLRVASFAQAVQVLTSIRVPKRLVMHGADEREHSFLVKGGEDLRQDERIQELFGLMNALFARDAQCVARGVSVRRYWCCRWRPTSA
jgi:DNA-dependent protein kinase catalytic subunit